MNALNISGWIACIVGSLLWFYGYIVTGTTALIEAKGLACQRA
jgi:hypothetical protein